MVDVRCHEVEGRFGSDDVICIPLLNVCNQSLCIYIHKQLYVYIVIMYSMHVELAVSLSMLAIWYEQCRYAYT